MFRTTKIARSALSTTSICSSRTSVGFRASFVPVSSTKRCNSSRPLGEPLISKSELKHEIDCLDSWYCKGAVSFAYGYTNCVFPVDADPDSKSVGRRFSYNGHGQGLPRHSGFQRFSLRQHLPPRFRRSKKYSYGDDSPRSAHCHERRCPVDADAGAVGLGGNS